MLQLRHHQQGAQSRGYFVFSMYDVPGLTFQNNEKKMVMGLHHWLQFYKS